MNEAEDLLLREILQRISAVEENIGRINALIAGSIESASRAESYPVMCGKCDRSNVTECSESFCPRGIGGLDVYAGYDSREESE